MYVAAKGGAKAISETEKLLEYYRCSGESLPIEVKQIMDQMRLAVDRVMGEGSLYAPDLAALAIKQAEGDTIEAAFLLRAFRSTLPRLNYSIPADSGQMRILRRISAAFKDIPGGQFLGPTRDYTKRLLNFKLMEETDQHVRDFVAEYELMDSQEVLSPPLLFPKVADLLRDEGLIESVKTKNIKNASSIQLDIDDITRQSLRFPASRAMRLQSLARGETGSMMALAYSSMRGYGNIHPCIGELRLGYVELVIPHPLMVTEFITVGEILLTEVEIIARMKDENKNSNAKFTLGYGICFGQNEIKAISMATLDRAMMAADPCAPAEDEEFVLYHIDGVEASGFTAHWKLPHYVDFQADLNRVRSINERRSGKNE